MNIHMVVAASYPARVIGREGQMPWFLPSDLARFRRITQGSSLIMGLGTAKSLRKPLKDRQNIVLTRSHGEEMEEMKFEPAATVDAALRLVQSSRIHVIGGQSIYEFFLPQTERIYYTKVLATGLGGDRYFPKINYHELSGESVVADEWTRRPSVEEELHGKPHAGDKYRTKFLVLERL